MIPKKTSATPNASHRPYTPAFYRLQLFLLVMGLLLMAQAFLPQLKPWALTFHGQDKHALPVQLSPHKDDTIQIHLPQRGYRELILLETVLTGKIVISIAKPEQPTEVFIFGAEQEHCQSMDAKDSVRCRFILHKENKTWQMTLQALPDTMATLSQLEIRYLRNTRVVAMDEGGSSFIFWVILASVPLAWLLHNHLSASQWMLIAVAICSLGMIHLQFGMILILFLTTLFFAGKHLAKATHRRYERLLLLGGLIIAFLVLLKYGQPLLIGLFPDIGKLGLALPLGLSYFIIRLLDTLFRWYRKEMIALNFREFMVFILFPATIPAGPIETVDQFHANRLSKITLQDIAWGLSRIGIGLFKKLVLVEGVLRPWLFSPPHELFFAITRSDSSDISVILALIVSFLYAYLDFSAYSDMAIGLSRLYGYHIMENFTWPILADNLREYWRRWHRSLSMWCMRNIYFPLVISTRNPFLPLFAVMTAVGTWHATNASWFSWAVHHATGLSLLSWIEKRQFRFLTACPVLLRRGLGWIMTIGFVCAGHSFVLYSDYSTALSAYTAFWRGLFFWPLTFFGG
ncbi:MAG: hypothetical protein H7832_04125 [Magnetococcus sp. DMHC-6]